MRKKAPIKRKWIYYENPDISHQFMDRVMKQSIQQFRKKFFHISKCLACNAEKTLELRWITKKRMSIVSYINVPMLHVMRMSQNQNNSKNAILQYGRVVEKDCCAIFAASGFPYLILCPR